MAADVITTTGIKHLEYQYDTSGIRVASAVDGQETRYLIDANQPYAQVLEEYTPAGTVQVSYVYGNDLISQTQSTGTTYYHVDGLGSTTALTDENGNVVSTSRYDAFGKTINETGTVDNKYLFAGEQFDAALGDYYLRARYYDVGIGRFTRRDTYEGGLSEPLSLHKYTYTHNNPINGTDPTGLFLIEEATREALEKDLQAWQARQTVVTLSTVRQQMVVVAGAVAAAFAAAAATSLSVARTLNKQFGIPVVFWGQDVSEVTEHQWKAGGFSGYTISNPNGRTGESAFISPALHRFSGYPQGGESLRGWYKGQPQCGCTGRATGLDCDEYPYNSVLEGGRQNYLLGKVSIQAVPASINQDQGRKLGLFYDRAGVTKADSENARTSLFLNVPMPSLGKSFWLDREGKGPYFF